MKLSCLFGGHDWDGCVCRRCGRKRDKDHDWDGCVCRRCGEKRDKDHDWNNCICRRCGKKKCESDPNHEWEFLVKEEKQCSMQSSHGGGQHLDPCYGVDCQFCDAGGYEDVYVCKNCGMEKREK